MNDSHHESQEHPKLTPPANHKGDMPWIRLRYPGSGPNVYKRMIEGGTARTGDIVAVYDKNDAPYGIAVFNQKSQIALRLISREHSDSFNLDDFLKKQIGRAVALRRDILHLDKTTNAYRIIHDHGDGLPGLTADVYGNYIVLEFYSFGMYRIAEHLERAFRHYYPEAIFVHRASGYTQTMEGFTIKHHRADRALKSRVNENGVLFEVNMEGGYKTGFFCDQRDNRLMASTLAGGRSVLDLCSYTGGFGIYAKKLGGAKDVTCVELDAEACDIMHKNANINNVRIDIACVDAFAYIRQMQDNNKKFGMVVLDPYKLIASRDGWEKGINKYKDFNRLAMSIVEEGGVFVTCSCSGLVSMPDFQQILRSSAGSAGRRVQIFRKTGAGPDHPVASDYPEGEYLKALWCRVF